MPLGLKPLSSALRLRPILKKLLLISSKDIPIPSSITAILLFPLSLYNLTWTVCASASYAFAISSAIAFGKTEYILIPKCSIVCGSKLIFSFGDSIDYIFDDIIDIPNLLAYSQGTALPINLAVAAILLVLKT